jgi:hypothetical protein
MIYYALLLRLLYVAFDLTIRIRLIITTSAAMINQVPNKAFSYSYYGFLKSYKLRKWNYLDNIITVIIYCNIYIALTAAVIVTIEATSNI